MTATFAIDVEPEHDLVHMTLSGFFDIATIMEFSAARRPAFARLTCPHNHHVVLLDISGCSLQSQEAVATFQKILDDRNMRSRKLAVVTGSSLSWMQARRIINRDGVTCFQTDEEARAWLLASADTDSVAATG